jgi:hypothetical protein
MAAAQQRLKLSNPARRFMDSARIPPLAGRLIDAYDRASTGSLPQFLTTRRKGA